MGTGMEQININGLAVDVHMAGRGSALLFLHAEEFFAQQRPWLDELARHFHVVAPRLPGFGCTPLPDGFRTIGDLSYFTLDLIAALKLRDVTLVGASMGGWVATDLCVKSTHDIARLVLVGAVGVKFGDREDRDFADLYALPAQDAIQRLFHKPDQWLPDHTRINDDQALEIARDRQSAALYLWKPYMHDPALRKWLHRIRVPALVIWGEHDGFVDASHAVRLAQALPDARTRLIAAAGHYPQIEQADQTAAAVVEFAQG